MKKEITGFLEKHKKPIVTAIVVVVVVALVWGGYKMLSRFLKNKKNAADAEDFTGTEVSSGFPVGDLCAQIAMACRGPFGWKTDEEAIYGALGQLRTQADWVYMQSYWATNVYSNVSNFGASMAWVFRNISQSLTGTLLSELSSSELQKCRDILTAKGITPGF